MGSETLDDALRFEELEKRRWVTTQDNNFTGKLATRLQDSGKVRVEGVDVDYSFGQRNGDLDIVTSKYNVEVKSGIGRNKLKLNQSKKNLEYSQSQGKGYILYSPKATRAQIKVAEEDYGIQVITDEKVLLRMLSQ